MKKHILLISFLLMGVLSATAAVKVVAPTTAIEQHQQVLTDKSTSKKIDKKIKRIQKRVEKLQEKREGEKKKFWTKLGFILGLIALIGGIVLGIAVIANPIGGFFYFLSGLLVTGGIVLILFAAST
jgi:hypothetical protein